MNAEELRLLSLMQEKIVEAMGPLGRGDRWCYLSTPTIINVVHWRIGSLAVPNSYVPFLVIPLAIDPENPERGLWGMIFGVKDLKENFYGDYVLTVSKPSKPYEQFGADTPYLALLKALAAQWGIKED